VKEERHCILILGTCTDRARCGWNCMLLANEEPQNPKPQEGRSGELKPKGGSKT
jgi:hypothetical protein